MSFFGWKKRTGPTYKVEQDESTRRKHEVPRCKRKTCGHSALIHEGWPENGERCYGDKCHCRRLIV